MLVLQEQAVYCLAGAGCFEDEPVCEQAIFAYSVVGFPVVFGVVWLLAGEPAVPFQEGFAQKQGY